MKKILSYDEYIKEDGGVAACNAGNTGGMGAISAPQAGAGSNGAVSTTPSGGNSANFGSGDVAAKSTFKPFKKIGFKNPSKKKKPGTTTGLSFIK